MADTNLEDVLEQLQFNYGGVLQKLAKLHDEVVDQMEMLKTAGTKIRRRNTSYAKDTVLVCVGRNNGNKFLKCKTAGTTSDVQWTEATYTGFTIGSTVNDGTVVWEVMETAFTSGSIVWSAMNASHAEIADYASGAGSADYASSAGYIGPFHVHQGARVESQTIVSSGVTSTFDGFNVTVQDDTRPLGTGGYIVNGNQNLPVQSFTNFLADGKTLYLFGSSGNPPYFECGFYFDDPKTPGAGEFVTALAKNEGGKIVQMQFGDIVTPWPGGEGGGEDYNGPFKVFIVGSSSVISNSGTASQTSSMKYDFELYDPTSPINSNTNKHEWGGKVFAGESYYQAGITSGSVEAGDFIYLVGDSRAGEVTFKYTNYEPEVTSAGGSDSSTGKQTITSAGFFTRIAQVHGASVTQIQHGDITVPPWKVAYADYAAMAASATHATYADNVDYRGPFRVAASGAEIQVYDDSWPNTFGGAVIIGSNGYRIGSATGLTSQAGFKIYLEGTSNYDGVVSLQYREIEDGTTISALEENQFLTPLAAITSGGIMQIQYGNITQPFHTEEYQGPFKVAIAETSTVVTNSGTESATSSTVYTVTITDTISAAEIPSDQKAGKVFDGMSAFEVPSSSITVNDGDYIYLKTSYSTINSATLFEFMTSSGSENRTRCFTRLAKNQGGKIVQIQHGDITIPQFVWSARYAESASSAVHATEADRFAYKGPFNASWSVTGQHISSIKFFDDTRNIGNDSSWAGAVIIGDSTYKVTSSSLGLILNGYRIYLKGTFVDGSAPSFVFGSIGSESVNPSVNANEFYTYLGFVSNGAFVRTQYGDIVQPVLGQGQMYNGPFKVQITSSSTTTSIVGESTISNTTYDVRVYDPTDSSSDPYHAGRVFDGASVTTLTSADIVGLQEGAFVYLNGIYGSGMGITDIAGANNASSFSIKLAQVSAGGIVQMQYGDVYSIPWNVTSAENATHATSADYATEAGYVEYKGPFHVSATSIDSTTNAAIVKIYDDTRRVANIGGCVVIGPNVYSASSSGGITLNDGYQLYLVGSSSSGSWNFGYSAASGNITPNNDEFWTQLAWNSGGKIVQIHYGDIVQPVENGGGGGGVTRIIGGSNVTIEPSSGTGEVTINVDSNFIFPADWNAELPLYAGSRYSTDLENTDTNYTNIGSGYGGLIIGQITAPPDVGVYDVSYEFKMFIKISPFSNQVVDLLVPKQTKVSVDVPNPDDLSGDWIQSIGSCSTPRCSPVFLVLPPNTYFELYSSNSQYPDYSSYNLNFYPFTTSPAPTSMNYNVTTIDGNGPGSLFYSLSERGNGNILIDASLDGQPIDFEGASVL